MLDWGDLLLRKYGKDRAGVEHDFTLNYLGYSTDNVSFLCSASSLATPAFRQQRCAAPSLGCLLLLFYRAEQDVRGDDH